MPARTAPHPRLLPPQNRSPPPQPPHRLQLLRLLPARVQLVLQPRQHERVLIPRQRRRLLGGQARQELLRRHQVQVGIRHGRLVAQVGVRLPLKVVLLVQQVVQLQAGVVQLCFQDAGGVLDGLRLQDGLLVGLAQGEEQQAGRVQPRRQLVLRGALRLQLGDQLHHAAELGERVVHGGRHGWLRRG